MTEQYTTVKSSDAALELNPLLRNMDLPVNRKDVDKPETVKWLIHNLGRRNSAHPDYPKARQLLVSLIRKRRLLKESELRELEKPMKELS